MRRLKNYIIGFRCETCIEERVFGNPPNDDEDNLYLYGDLSGATRCFCKNHMSYGKENNGALLDYEDDWEYPLYGARLISEIIRESEEDKECCDGCENPNCVIK